MPERDKKPSSDADDLIPRSMLPDRSPPRPRTKAGRIPLEQIEAMMGETKEGEKIVKKSKGGGVFKKGGSVKSSASRRADGIAQRGKTRGKFV